MTKISKVEEKNISFNNVVGLFFMFETYGEILIIKECACGNSIHETFRDLPFENLAKLL